MKVLPRNALNNYNPAARTVSKTDDKKLTQKSKNFDEIVIRAKSMSISEDSIASEDKFITDLTSKISEELRTPTSSQELSNIKEQIEQGSYKIDFDSIVKKMLVGCL